MPCRIAYLIAIVGLLTGIADAAAEERTWTNTKGQKMQAEFVRENGGEVTFLKDGKLVTVQLADLSEADRKVVQDLAAGKPVEAPAPAAAAPPSEPEKTTPAEAALARGAKKTVPVVSRQWTDKYGNQTKAKFVRMFDGKVVLSQTSNNKTITLGFYELIDEDQDHVRALLTSRGQEGLIPPPPLVAQASAEPGTPVPALPAFTPPPSIPSPPSLPPPPIPGSGSSLIEEMRQRHEQARQEMMQRSKQLQEEQAQRFADLRQKSEEDRERRRQEAEERQQAEEERRQNEQVGECLSCKGKLTRAQTELETCPHCGVKWEFEVDAFGHKRPIFKTTSTIATSLPRSGAPAANPPKVDPAAVARISRFIVIGVVVVGLLGVMVVVVAAGIAIIAASGSKPKQKFY